MYIYCNSKTRIIIFLTNDQLTCVRRGLRFSPTQAASTRGGVGRSFQGLVLVRGSRRRERDPGQAASAQAWHCQSPRAPRTVWIDVGLNNGSEENPSIGARRFAIEIKKRFTVTITVQNRRHHLQQHLHLDPYPPPPPLQVTPPSTPLPTYLRTPLPEPP